MVRPACRTRARRAASPTRIPSGVNETTDGSSRRPSASAIARGSPVASSTYATRLLVGPRSMPMIRGMRALFLSQDLIQILDDRSEIGSRGQRLLAGGEDARPIVHAGAIPRFGQRPAQTGLFLAVSSIERGALLAQPGPA